MAHSETCATSRSWAAAAISGGRLSLLLDAICYPVRYWNWKTAGITAGIRAVLFLLVIGHRHGGGPAAVESAYVVFTSGFFSAMQQAMLKVRAQWLANLGIVVAVPVASQAIDSLVHLAAGTPNLRTATLSVMVYALISAAFHLHVMRRGAMLTGADAQPLLVDLKRIPELALSFACAPFAWLANLVGGNSTAAGFEASGAE